MPEIQNYCCCVDCIIIDNPCFFDCDSNDLENACIGCLEAIDEINEIKFEIDLAQGKL